MSRTQILQLSVVILLLIFVGILVYMKNGALLTSGPVVVPLPPAVTNPSSSDNHAQHSREPAVGNGVASSSDNHAQHSREPAVGNGVASSSDNHPEPPKAPPPPLITPPPEETDLDALRDPFETPPMLKELLLKRALEKQRKQDFQRQLLERQGKVPVPSAVPIQPPSLQLQGILWGSARPQAIINRRIVSVGDTVEGATIVAVSKEGVNVSFSGQEIKLKLPQRGALDGSSRREMFQ